MDREKRYESWGRYPVAPPHEVIALQSRDQVSSAFNGKGPVLAYGLGRSYGDVCLNEDGVLLDTAGLDRILAFDTERGLLRCEAGVSLEDILNVIVSKGWFLPVTPGTKFVTIGGAIANDVHGKNHHRVGTFGRHLTQLELVRSNGERQVCSPTENPDLFRATVGGLGLTGLITWAEFELQPVDGPGIEVDFLRFGSLEEFFDLSEESSASYEHTVAWVDCMVGGSDVGRGVFIRGNTAPPEGVPLAPSRTFTFPLDAPTWMLNRLSVRCFNSLFYWVRPSRVERRLTHYEPFFYPLDKINRWNRLYGKRGFVQYQFVVPMDGGQEAVREVLTRVANSGRGSFLAVLKVFGDLSSPGLLSFPRPGLTLTLDFPVHRKTFALLDTLDRVVLGAGGSLYPAKDARMSGESFRRSFPQWEEFASHIDPAFSSSFWRRVTGVEQPTTV